MVKKIVYTLILILLIAIIGFFFIAGKIVDEQNNIILHTKHDTLTEVFKNYHNNLIIADWHADNLLWDRNPLLRQNHGHVDIPRLIEGNFTLQVFDAVIKTPKGINYEKNTGDTDNITLLAMVNRWPIKTWNSLLARALHQSDKLHKAAEFSDSKLRIIKSKSDLEKLLLKRDSSKQLIGGLLSIEGLHALEGKLENLEVLYNAGYRMMGLTHFFDNEVGGSSAGVEQGGLTEFGKEVIEKMNEMGIIIDLAHASPRLISDVLALSSSPIVVSHTGVKGIFDSPRNLSDDQLRAIKEKGGIIGIGFWNGALGEDISPGAIARAIRYTSNIVGVEHVGLGSDWDGATTTYFDASNISLLTQALVAENFSPEEIALIMGRNQIHFLHDQLK